LILDSGSLREDLVEEYNVLYGMKGKEVPNKFERRVDRTKGPE